jgi:hypothetical protein
MGKLLDLPTEMFEEVLGAFADSAELAEVFRARAVCR